MQKTPVLFRFPFLPLILSLGSSAYWAHSAWASDDLKGLTQVSISVDDLGEDAKFAGLTRVGVEDAVHKVMTKSGLRIGNGPAILYVNVKGMKIRRGSYAYTCSLGLNEPVKLLNRNMAENDPAKQMSASTWFRSRFGTTSSKTFVTDVKGCARVLAQRFVTEHAGANAEAARQIAKD